MRLLLLLACTPKSAPYPAAPEPVDAVVTGQAMGGELKVIVRCPSWTPHSDCLSAGLAARTRIEAIEAVATDWTPAGQISQLNAAAGGAPVPVSPDVAAMLEKAQLVASATDGAFDITINALWGLWDFERGVRPSPEAIAERLPLIDWRELSVRGGEAALARPGMSATLGGIAQGYAAAEALKLLPEGDAMVDLSGDLAARGAWRVGIQHPRAPRGELIASLTLVDASLTTSGDYERFFLEDGVRYHHILDPHTGMPASGAISATAVHPDGAVADALATALIVTGPDPRPVEGLGAWALVVTADGAVHELGERGAWIRDLTLLETR